MDWLALERRNPPGSPGSLTSEYDGERAEGGRALPRRRRDQLDRLAALPPSRGKCVVEKAAQCSGGGGVAEIN